MIPSPLPPIISLITDWGTRGEPGDGTRGQEPGDGTRGQTGRFLEPGDRRDVFWESGDRRDVPHFLDAGERRKVPHFLNSSLSLINLPIDKQYFAIYNGPCIVENYSNIIPSSESQAEF